MYLVARDVRTFKDRGRRGLRVLHRRRDAAAWDSMVAAVAEEEDHGGLLAKPFADAGVGDGGVRIPSGGYDPG